MRESVRDMFKLHPDLNGESIPHGMRSNLAGNSRVAFRLILSGREMDAKKVSRDVPAEMPESPNPKPC
jgi:hypothetical protein